MSHDTLEHDLTLQAIPSRLTNIIEHQRKYAGLPQRRYIQALDVEDQVEFSRNPAVEHIFIPVQEEGERVPTA